MKVFFCLLVGVVALSDARWVDKKEDARNGASNALIRNPRSIATVNVHNSNSQYVDKSIHLSNVNFHGSHNIVIGHGNKGKRDVSSQINEESTAATEEKTEGENLIRSKRWGFKVKVDNSNTNIRDESIHLNDANFKGSSNVVIGHGNTVGRTKREADDASPSQSETQLTRSKRWGFKVKVDNTNINKRDESIHLNKANFAGSSNVVIGHGNKLSKRDVSSQTQTKTDINEYESENEQLVRSKRWGIVFKGKNTDVDKTNCFPKPHGARHQNGNIVIGNYIN